MKHSRRYQEVKEKIPSNKYYNLSEAIDFLQNNNAEKLKNIKINFALNWEAQKQKTPFRAKIILPYPLPAKGKIAVVKNDLSDNTVGDLAKNKAVELLAVEEIHQRIMTETKNKVRKRSQWGFEKLVLSPQNEKIFKSPEKLPPKLFGLIARKVSLNENIIEEVEKFQKGEKEIKIDKGGNIQAVIGKSDFSPEQLIENYQAVYQKINS
jgi:large subunit ribosomal protein L1